MKQWINEHSIVMTLAIVVAIMVMIFCFSAQTGEESGAMSGRITTWVVKLFVPDFENLPEEEREELCDTVGLVIRKTAHFSEYALLGFFLMLHIGEIKKKMPVRFGVLWSWGVGTLYAVSDELHQGFVGGRSPAVLDVCIDSCGVMAGTVLLMLMVRCLRNRKMTGNLHRKRKKCRFWCKKS